ncbi:hypothetical protein NCHU2750_05600 [Neorhizobium sp. NCHU2750]|nr:hypothetical protein NCHU2750_05600 [Neorhizobium sp. NCHU2750]
MYLICEYILYLQVICMLYVLMINSVLEGGEQGRDLTSCLVNSPAHAFCTSSTPEFVFLPKAMGAIYLIVMWHEEVPVLGFCR